MESHCAQCGAPFACNPGPDCWCAELPFVPMPDRSDGCLCPACLRARLERSTPSDPAST